MAQQQQPPWANPYSKYSTVSGNTSSSAFTNCFENVSLNPQVQEALANRLSSVFRIYHGYLPLPLAALGLILTLLYISAVTRAIRQHRVSRKCYVLLLNRAIGDVLACLIAFCIVAYVLGVEEVNKNVTQLLDVFFVSSFWSGMVSYVSLSLLKLYAIARPLDYRKKVTMGRCIYLMVFSWLVFLVMTAYALSVTALVKIPALNEWSGCRIETCLRVMYRLRNLLNVVVYSFTISCFLITVLLVRKARNIARFFHQHSVNTESSIRRKHRFPLWKLALNVGTFAAFNVFYVIWAIFMVANTDKCFFVRNYASMMQLLGLIRCTLLLRIIMDPILSFITDLQVRRSMLAMLGMTDKIFPFTSHRKDQPTEEENSSDFIPITHITKVSFSSQMPRSYSTRA